MLKVLAAVLAVLSAAISITIYTATLPDVQKQAANNASAIEQIQSAVENIPEEKKLYLHKITIYFDNTELKLYYNLYSSQSEKYNFTTLQDFFVNDIHYSCTGQYKTGGVYYNIIAIGNIYNPAPGAYALGLEYLTDAGAVISGIPANVYQISSEVTQIL